MRLKGKEKVSLDEAERRLLSYAWGRDKKLLYSASQLAEVIWPGHSMKAQGAGGAANYVLKKLKFLYTWEYAGPHPKRRWGWMLIQTVNR